MSARTPGRVPAADLPTVIETRLLMRGRVSIALRDERGSEALEAEARRLLDRIAAWVSRLTRFDAASELSRLNATADATVVGPTPIGPTLAAVLDWAREAESATDGTVDVSLLEQRLAAEWGTDPGVGLAFAADAAHLADAGHPADAGHRPHAASPAGRRWALRRGPRTATVIREPGVHFDLDGVAKGWLADRALARTTAASAVVDADGDIAVRVAPGDEWLIGVADPRDGSQLAILRLDPDGIAGLPAGRHATLGVATSGTSVHRWTHAGSAAHHLIDPATGRPAATDVVQATVIATSARLAEAFAKTAVIAGADAAFDRLARPGVLGALLLTDRGEVRATPETTRWLA